MFLYILTTTEYKYNLCQSGTGISSGLQLLNDGVKKVFKGRLFLEFCWKQIRRVFSRYYGLLPWLQMRNSSMGKKPYLQ